MFKYPPFQIVSTFKDATFKASMSGSIAIVSVSLVVLFGITGLAWPAGWLAGWLADWLAWLAGWLAGWVAGWLADWLASSHPSKIQAKNIKLAHLIC